MNARVKIGVSVFQQGDCGLLSSGVTSRSLEEIIDAASILRSTVKATGLA